MPNYLTGPLLAHQNYLAQQAAGNVSLFGFNSTSAEIKIEAARALLKIAPSQVELLVKTLQSVDPTKRDGIAWALAKAGGFDISQLLSNQDDQDLRRWVSYVAGYGKARFPEEQINRLFELDAEVHFAASVLWQLLSSWIYELVV